jgi:hypothetical protein
MLPCRLSQPFYLGLGAGEFVTEGDDGLGICDKTKMYTELIGLR